MKKNILVLIILLVNILLSTGLFAVAPGPFSFSKIGLGVRPMSLGESFTAVSDDANAFYWNPAGTTQIKQIETMFAYNLWLEGVGNGLVAVAIPFKSQCLSLGYSFLDYGTMKGYDDNDSAVPDFTAKDSLMGIGYGLQWGNISFGTTIKFLQEQIEQEKSQLIAADIGTIYKLDKTGRIQLGLLVQNLTWQKSRFREKEEAVLLTIKLGSAMKLLDDKLLLSMDLNQPMDNNLKVSVGCEYLLAKMFAIRQ